MTYEVILTEKKNRIDMLALYALLSHGAGSMESCGIPDWSGVLRIGLACCRLSRHGAQRTGLA